jgi:acyl-CoA hydrolase
MNERAWVDPSWRERYADLLMSPQEAVQATVETGGSVWVGGWTSVPVNLCSALVELAPALDGTHVTMFLSPFNWDVPNALEHFRISCCYGGPHDRQALNEGRIDYVPVVRWRTHEMPPGMEGPFDVAMMPISPPDKDGWCSFAGGVWFGQSVRKVSRKLVGEVRVDAIRTGGENRIHIGEFSGLVEAAPATAPPVVPPRSAETEDAANVICSLVATQILHDGATVQMGVGDVSAAMPLFMEHLQDISIHTEIVPGGVAGLVDRGVVNGKNNALHPGKVVGTAFVLLPPEELTRIDSDDAFELYDFTVTDDLRNLLQLRDFFAINNALAVDLTGNVTAESRGSQIYSGPGGQTVFAVAAATVNSGSVIVLPSSQLLPSGERVSRILPTLETGSTVTVHRGYVDYVVTEHGIAHLTGKSLRGRISEMLAVSHPDLRAELRQWSRRTYGAALTGSGV